MSVGWPQGPAPEPERDDETSALDPDRLDSEDAKYGGHADAFKPLVPVWLARTSQVVAFVGAVAMTVFYPEAWEVIFVVGFLLFFWPFVLG